MKLYLLLLLFLAVAQPEQRYFHYERPLQLPAQSAAKQTCSVLDPAIFEHSAPQLTDLRLYSGTRETAYVITNRETTATSYPKNQPLNLGTRNGKVTFDVKMPQGPYNDVWLDIDPSVQDFVVTVSVSGRESLDQPQRTDLGSYTIFDLTKQSLGRSTILHLPASTFAYLHFSLAGPLHPDAVKSLTYATTFDHEPANIAVAESSQPQQMGRNTVYKFEVPENVPVDAIHFIPSASGGNFHRQVEIRQDSSGKQAEVAQPFISNVDILRYHGTQNGKKIDEEQLQQRVFSQFGKTHWTVTIQNGDDPPLDLSSVKLEMFERRICFDATAGASYTLYYGDGALSAPQYDYAGFFHAEKDAAQATLGPELANPQYTPRPDGRPFTEKHPELLWVTLILVVTVLGGIAFRSAKRVEPQ